MTPFIHQGMMQRYLQIMEAVPLAKIIFGSDAYNVPELYWLAARMMTHLNNRQVYNLKD